MVAETEVSAELPSEQDQLHAVLLKEFTTSMTSLLKETLENALHATQRLWIRFNPLLTVMGKY